MALHDNGCIWHSSRLFFFIEDQTFFYMSKFNYSLTI